MSDRGLQQLNMVPYVLLGEERRNDNGISKIEGPCISKQGFRRFTATEVGPRCPGPISRLLNCQGGPPQSAVQGIMLTILLLESCSKYIVFAIALRISMFEFARV